MAITSIPVSPPLSNRPLHPHLLYHRRSPSAHDILICLSLSRHLGPKQPARLHFHQLELSWLASYVRLVHGVRTGGGLDFDLSLLDMPVLVQQFNRHFQGRLIPGLTQVRPVRTIPSLRAELGRIDEVVRLTGMAVKKPAPTRGGKPRGPRGDGGGQGGRGGKGGGPGRGGMGGAGGAISV